MTKSQRRTSADGEGFNGEKNDGERVEGEVSEKLERMMQAKKLVLIEVPRNVAIRLI